MFAAIPAVYNGDRRPTGLLAAAAVSVVLAISMPALADTGSGAAETLLADGAILRTESVDPADAILDKRVLAMGDPVDASFVVLREHSTNRLLQRTNTGFFVPWDGRSETLADNRFPAEDGVIRFKILRDSVAGLLFPLSVAIGYRTGGVLKTGQFAIEAATAEGR